MFSKEDKRSAQNIKGLYRDLAAGKTPPYEDSELPHNLEQAVQLESEILGDVKTEINQRLASGSAADRKEIPNLMSTASASVQNLDDIVEARRDHSKGFV